MKLKNIDKVMAGILFVFLSFVVASWVRADETYYILREEASVPEVMSSFCTAKAAAAGQQNFKATDRLQWSAAISSDNCSTAAQIGLGIQVGEVFVTGNIADNIFSSVESDPMVSISASGTF